MFHVEQKALFMAKFLLNLFIVMLGVTALTAQVVDNKFAQIDDWLPTPNAYRTASGAPGHDYWQNEADYVMEIELDDDNQIIYGKQTITYQNNSPDPLSYLWLQLDQNVRSKESDSYKITQSRIEERVSAKSLDRLIPVFDGGFKIVTVQDQNGLPLPYIINNTMMRITPAEPILPGESYSFQTKWWYNINDRMSLGGRSGYEYFEEDGNYLYTIAQFYPRMCVYNDMNGWQNKQFLGRGEFSLSFGDYDVRITVPGDHLVASTGVLHNPNEVLTIDQRDRLEKARRSFNEPVIIASEHEARKRERQKIKKIQTWHFTADNVRDFAFASSRKFIWDAMGVRQSDGSTVMAMSMYPKEGNPLWETYSTKVIAHTLKWYSHYTFDYPYPVAWSIHTDRIGMEYPMISFNGGRPEKDGSYTKRTKYALISVIIHEIGHNYFPMIVNSDERQWTWMDEGLNTFLQYLTEQQFERNYPSRRGAAHKIVDYMKGDKSNISPIMTNSESLHQPGNNAYGKPATALNILRETIMGRELFDIAFKEYARRWKFKHPTPADFFRTMEDASAIDLDWFWKGWFYSTDHVDISLDEVAWFNIDSEKPLAENNYNETNPSPEQRYNNYNQLEATTYDQRQYEKLIDSLTAHELGILNSPQHYYELTLTNQGGLPMPVILDFEFIDGTHEEYRIPAEIWRFDDKTINKVFAFEKIIKRIVLDPYLETADVNRANNYFPQQIIPSRFQLYREKKQRKRDPMQQPSGAKP